MRPHVLPPSYQLILSGTMSKCSRSCVASVQGPGLSCDIVVNALVHLRMLKLHHMNLLNEIQETTLMMNLYQQQQVSLRCQNVRVRVIHCVAHAVGIKSYPFSFSSNSSSFSSRPMPSKWGLATLKWLFCSSNSKVQRQEPLVWTLCLRRNNVVLSGLGRLEVKISKWNNFFVNSK